MPAAPSLSVSRFLKGFISITLDLQTPGETEPGWGVSTGGNAMLSLYFHVSGGLESTKKGEQEGAGGTLCLCAKVKVVLSVHRRIYSGV